MNTSDGCGSGRGSTERGGAAVGAAAATVAAVLLAGVATLGGCRVGGDRPASSGPFHVPAPASAPASAPAPVATPATAAPAWDTIVLVRHAEKQEGGRDPSLTDAGRRRADRLADMLADAGVTAVFTTPYARTRETAGPIAERCGVPVEEYDPRQLAAFAETLRGTPGRIVVVGHSNTTPDLVARLGGDAGPPIDDATEFDRVYVLVPGGGDPAGDAATVRLSSGG